MRSRSSLLAVRAALAVASLPLVVRAQGASAPPPTLPALSFPDQFGAVTALSPTPETPVIVLSSAREGSDAMARWVIRLRSAVPPSDVRILSIADLKGAPRFVRGMIRGSLPRDTAARVLLDWDGKFARPMRGETRALVAAVYGRDGKLRRWDELSLSAVDTELADALVRAARAP